MSPRPRKVSDDDVFAAAHRVMGRAGPSEMTLSEIGKEAGLTAGALVQRFGSKLGLLRALSARLSEESPAMLAAIRGGNPSPLQAVRVYADCLAQMGESPGGLAHHLAWLQLDLTDQDMHRELTRQGKEARDTLRRWLDEAVTAHELRSDTDTAALARSIQVTATGSLMVSAFETEKPTAAMRRDIDSLLQPHLAPRQGRLT